MKYILIILLFFSSQFVLSQDLTEQFFNATVKIDATYEIIRSNTKKTENSIGTGFFMTLEVEKTPILCLVTNKHNVDKSNVAVLKFNLSDSNYLQYGNIVNCRFKNFKKLWIYHPKQDLAILPIIPIINKIQEKYKKLINLVSFNEGNLLTDSLEKQLSAMLEIIMIGYPKGFVDTANNIPVIRKGITASPIFLNFNNQPQFLADLPIYSGSSGSPIIFYTNGTYTDKKGNTSVGSNILVLLGIAVQAKEYLATGNTVSNDPKLKLTTNTWLPFNIAVAIKSNVLNDFKPLILKYINDENIVNEYLNSFTFWINK